MFTVSNYGSCSSSGHLFMFTMCSLFLVNLVIFACLCYRRTQHRPRWDRTSGCTIGAKIIWFISNGKNEEHHLNISTLMEMSYSYSYSDYWFHLLMVMLNSPQVRTPQSVSTIRSLRWETRSLITEAPKSVNFLLGKLQFLRTFRLVDFNF